MSRKRHTVLLEFAGPEIFCHWNDDPPVQGCGGATYRLLPGESLHDAPYEAVRALGEGRHVLEFDAHLPSQRRERRRDSTDDGERFQNFLFWSFWHRIGLAPGNEYFCKILMTLNRANADRVIARLGPDELDKLRAFAEEIGPTPEARAREDHFILSSSGTTTSIPDENLEVIRERFLE